MPSQVLQDAAAVVQVVCFDSVVLRVALRVIEIAAAAPGRRVARVVQQILQATCATRQILSPADIATSVPGS